MSNPRNDSLFFDFGCSMALSWVTSAGVREENQDYLGVMIINEKNINIFLPGGETVETPNENYSEEIVIGVISDGVGGLPNGEVASNFVIRDFFRELSENNLNRKSLMNIIEFSILTADQNLKKIHPGSGATIVVFCIIGENLFVTHAGDSRAYVKKENGHIWRTIDHAFSDVLYVEGKITEVEAISHPMRGRINSCLGMKCELTTEELGSDWKTVLLSSDGYHSPFLTDTVSEDLDKSLDELLQKSLDHDSKDNISILRIQKISH